MSLRSEELNTASDMSPDNVLMACYDDLTQKGLVVIEKTEEGGIAWIKLTSLGKTIQKELS